MWRFVLRLWAFLTGDMVAAEDIAAQSKDYPPVEWIQSSASDDAVATYALEASLRAAADANAAVKAIQDRANSLLGTILVLFPLSVGVTILAVPKAKHVSAVQLASFGLFMMVDLLLALAATLAFLSSGLLRGGGLNLENYGQKAASLSAPGLKAIEADAWYMASRIAFDVGQRKAQDLFGARRAVVGALLAAVLASPFLFVARGDLTPAPKTSPSAKPSVLSSPKRHPAPRPLNGSTAKPTSK
jgi:hypothetical protein